MSDDASRLRRFLSELKRRRVYRTAAAYGAAGFVVVEVADIVVPALLLPGWVTRVVVMLVLLGFPVAVVLAWAMDVGPDGVRRTPPAAGQPTEPVVAEGGSSAGEEERRAARWGPGAYVVAGLVVVGVGFGAYTFLEPALHGHGRGGDDVRSLAVLPFADLSPSGDQEYFSHGIAEEIRTALGKLKGLRMAARGASFSFRGIGVDPRVVGDSLGVDAVLEGSVRKSGEEVKISAELVETQDGFSLWADSYERSLDDLFAVQEEIARSIVTALQYQVGRAGGPAERLVERRTDDLEAYTLYLKGRHALNQRTGEGMEAAVRYFEGAVERDSTLAAAHAGLADARSILVAYGFRPGAALERAREDARRALALSPGMVEAHASLGWIRTARWEWEAGETAFLRALELDPTYATAHQWYAWNLANRGRTREAVQAARRAARLDSVSLIVATDLGIMLYHDGRPEAAAAQLRAALDRDPGFAVAHEWMGLVELAAGREEDAVAALRRALELSTVRSYQTVASLGLAQGLAGHRAEARKLLDELERRARDEPVSAAATGLVQLGLGETGKATALFERAAEDGDPFLGTYLVPLTSPLLSGLRERGHLDGVLDQMRLAAVRPPDGTEAGASDGRRAMLATTDIHPRRRQP